MTNAKIWLDKALYDLDAAEDMLKSKKYDYTAYFCHQALEKAIKSFFIFSKSQMAPYIHNLVRLAELSNIWEDLEYEQQDFLEEINPFYIELRYPVTDRVGTNEINQEQAERYKNQTAELLKWLENKMKF